ncbi:mitogen-activated protein kinase 15 [Spatholobus suberectus]|nr:mitogen-activated protein kinase 15 [Spatholobus suberectus]
MNSAMVRNFRSKTITRSDTIFFEKDKILNPTITLNYKSDLFTCSLYIPDLEGETIRMMNNQSSHSDESIKSITNIDRDNVVPNFDETVWMMNNQTSHFDESIQSITNFDGDNVVPNFGETIRMTNNQTSHSDEPIQSITNFDATPEKGWGKFLKQAVNLLAHQNQNEWLKDMRGNLSLVATVISTMTFQVAINPPGGVRPPNENRDVECPTVPTYTESCPGEAILAIVFPHDYYKFLAWNTVCFVASLSVCLLLVSGLPLEHRLTTWLLSMGMCITITSLALTYMYAASMVTPLSVWGTAYGMFEVVLRIWVALIGIIDLFLVIRLFVGYVNYWIEKGKPQEIDFDVL